MTGWIVAVLLGLVLLFLFSSLRLSHKQRLDLSVYAAMLLLEDSVRADHQRKIVEWIAQNDSADTPAALAIQASSVIENMGTQISHASHGLLGLGEALWKCKLEASTLETH